ncbi:uncharacterized protein LOC113374906 [Ctenocephalides felis]|uniref:uncharacterized protein LOC113374906 n=1 Tax=Ctenocephalides felis TaxID=7515 RepID=UPI000E6E1574|nr:uncharacterized protein LOC113374906 [Ctenocephalides felis]
MLSPYTFGAPYFKDSDYFPGPVNVETIRIREKNILRYINLNLSNQWTLREKSKLKRAIKRQVGDDCYNETSIDWHKIAALNVPQHSVDECKAMWNLVLHPNLSKAKWSKSETEKLIKAAEKHKFHNWEEIAKDLNCGRSHLQCFIHFHREVIPASNARWSPVEEQKLLSAVEKFRVGNNFISWGTICQFFDFRTREQIYSKFLTINPNIKKGRFSEEEDCAIIAALITYNNDFKAIPIEDILPGRSLKQIKVRYNNTLKHTNSPVQAWDCEKDIQLLELVQQHGRKWSKISKLMDFRTGSSCRHRYDLLKDFIDENPGATVQDAPRKPRIPKRGPVGKILNKIDEKLEIENPPLSNVESSSSIDLEISQYFGQLDYYKHIKDRQTKTVFNLSDLNSMKNMVYDILQIFGVKLTQDTIKNKISKTTFHNYTETEKLLLNYMIGHYTDPIYNDSDNDSIEEDWLIPTSSKLKRTSGDAEFCYDPLANKKIKTYSRKCKNEKTEINCEDDSIRNATYGSISHTLLPPNSSTLLGLRSLLIYKISYYYNNRDKIIFIITVNMVSISRFEEGTQTLLDFE